MDLNNFFYFFSTPADYFGNEIVLRQLGELSMVKEQEVVKKNRNPKFEDHVKEYLRGLLVILVEPIISMTAVEFLEIKVSPYYVIFCTFPIYVVFIIHLSFYFRVFLIYFFKIIIIKYVGRFMIL